MLDTHPAPLALVLFVELGQLLFSLADFVTQGGMLFAALELVNEG